ncbi:MAG: hypothetical protein QM731_02030 [Chitinophagaceae bacterium]
MKKQTILLFFALCCLGIAACKKNSSDPQASFEENVKIAMSETLAGTKRTLVFKCMTEKSYPCINYFLETSHAVTNSKITINFIQVTGPNICLTAVGPASTVIELDELSGETKDYGLELNFGGLTVTGQLSISGTSYKATIPAQTKVQFVNPVLGRIPDNTVFGTVHYHFASTAATVQKFTDSLQYYGATSALYPPGDYLMFQIDANGQIKQTQDQGYYFTRYYIFNYSSDITNLKNLVYRYGKSKPDSLLATLNTSKGETFYSWAPK